MAFLLYLSAKYLILDRENPKQAATYFIPFYSFFVSAVICLVTARKGLKHVGINWTDNEIYLFTIGISIAVSILTFVFLFVQSKNIRNVENQFGILMVVTACAMAFAHGSNDVANAIGPIAAIVSIVSSDGTIQSSSELNSWVLLLGAVGIVAGLAIMGRHVIKTVGEKITTLTPSLGFSANMATASTVLAASYLGFPISTTHTLVGGVIGVGLARGYEHLDINSIKRIFASWIITIPVGATFTILFYVILRLIFNV